MRYKEFIEALSEEEKYVELEPSEEETEAKRRVLVAACNLRESLVEDQYAFFSAYASTVTEYLSEAKKSAFKTGIKYTLDLLEEKDKSYH